MFPLAVRGAPLAGVSKTVAGGVDSVESNPVAEMETTAPAGPLFGLTDKRLIFCAFKGTMPVATKSKIGNPKTLDARVAKNAFKVGKMIPA